MIRKSKERTKYNNTKIFYYCHKNPFNHIHFYLGWIENVCRKNFDMKLISTYSKRNSLFDSKYVKLLKSVNIFDSFVVPLYFLRNFRQKEIVVITRRRLPIVLILIRPFMHDMKLVLDLEGYSKAEHEYSIAQLAKKKFIKKFFLKLNNYIKNDFFFRISLRKVDRVVVVSEYFKNYLIKNFNLRKKKVFVFPPGVDTNEIYFDNILREKLRKRKKIENKFVWFYAGNTLPWQNLDKLLLIFRDAWFKDNRNFMIMLIRDKASQNKFRKKLINLGIPYDSFLITQADRSEINNYLNIADLGLIHRENHLLNKVALPGKVGEYVLTGLTVLTTPYIGDYYNDMKNIGNGIFITESNSPSVLNKKIFKFLKSGNWRRGENRSKIASKYWKKYSTNANIELYCKMLENLKNEKKRNL